LKDKDSALPGEFIREGLTAVVSVKLREAEFEGQTKTRLGNVPVKHIVEEAVVRSLTTLFDWHPSVAKEIISKAVRAQAASNAAKAARDLVSFVCIVALFVWLLMMCLLRRTGAPKIITDQHNFTWQAGRLFFVSLHWQRNGNLHR
jgi:ascorbate-specific PTS system EIIC-type component UlaA